MGTYVAHMPEDYHPYFQHKGVKAIVRLNNQVSRALMRHVHILQASVCSRSAEVC
jgi:hypothetical protein